MKYLRTGWNIECQEDDPKKLKYTMFLFPLRSKEEARRWIEQYTKQRPDAQFKIVKI